MWTASSQNMWAFIRYLIYANHRNSPVNQLFHTERVIIIYLPTETRLYTFWRLKPDEAVSKRTLSPEELNKQLEKLLLEDMAGDERIFDWVEVDLRPAL